MQGLTNRAIARRMDRAIGPVCAVMLGLASAFFCVALPGGVAGLPPSGVERLLIALAIGGGVGLATWRGFALLDRRSQLLLLPAPSAERMARLPALRRADAHPDAPARRPILAGSDLGSPTGSIAPLPAEWTHAGEAIDQRADLPPLEPLGFPPIAAFDAAVAASSAAEANESAISFAPAVIAPALRPLAAGPDAPLDLIEPLPAEWHRPVYPVEPAGPDESMSSPQPGPPPPDPSPGAGGRAIDGTPAMPTIPALPPEETGPAAEGDPVPVVAAGVDPSAADPPPALAALMTRLEAGLARKTLVLAGAGAGVTALRRGIRPVAGSLGAAIDRIEQRAADFR